MQTQAQNIAGGKYGTSGLPKFGTKYIDSSKNGQITELDGAFNQFLETVKGMTAPGNEIALAQFSEGLIGLYWHAVNCVAGKPVVNA